MFFEPLHERRKRLKILSPVFESVRRHGDVLVTRVVPRHVAEHELAGVVLARREEVMDFARLSFFVLKKSMKKGSNKRY